MSNKSVTVVSVGDVGVGKSALGNLYLQNKFAFATSDSAQQITSKVSCKSSVVDGIEFNFVDTEGMADVSLRNSEQTRNLVKFLNNWSKGINGIAIVINGQACKFSQSVKDNIKNVYEIGKEQDILKHICIVFTRCYQQVNVHRQNLQNEFLPLVSNYLNEISGRPEKYDIPGFFVDCLDENSEETKQNMNQFRGWLCSKEKLDPKQFVIPTYYETRSKEYKYRVKISEERTSNCKYYIFQDFERTKIVPNNGDQIRYTDWVPIRTYKEEVERFRIETQTVRRGDTIEGDYRYKNYVNQQRIVTINPKTNYVLNYGEWSDIKTWKEESGHRIQTYETRNESTVEMDVTHHDSHSWSGFSSHDHTHWTKYRTSWTERREIFTDFDGNITYSPWQIVGGKSRLEIGSGRCKGWIKGY